MRGRISLSGDGEALIVCARELLVIPIGRVVRVAVSKRSRARGPGGSRLELICLDGDGETAIGVGEGDHPDAMDSSACRLAGRIGRPVEIGVASPDV